MVIQILTKRMKVCLAMSRHGIQIKVVFENTKTTKQPLQLHSSIKQ